MFQRASGEHRGFAVAAVVEPNEKGWEKKGTVVFGCEEDSGPMEFESDGSPTLNASRREMMFMPEMLLCSQPPQWKFCTCQTRAVASLKTWLRDGCRLLLDWIIYMSLTRVLWFVLLAAGRSS